MPGTKRGGLRAARTNKIKHGDDFYARIGSMGGKAKVPKGFAKSGLAASAGRKGGATSSRSKDKRPLEFRRDIADFKQGFNEPTFAQKVVRRFTHV